MIIDFHTHTFPDRIAPGAVDKLQAMSHTHPFSDGTAAKLRASMTAAGIDASLVLPVATSPRQVEHVNDASIAMNDAGGQTGLFSFGCMHPDYPDVSRELRRLARAGVRGVKLHPPYQNADFDDPRYRAILEEAGAQGLMVLVHAGLDVGMPGVQRGSPEMILRAVQAAGPVTLILAHMGGWHCWDRVLQLLPGTGVFLDTSFSLGAMTPNGDGYYPTPASLQLLTNEQFTALVRAFGADHILFGTDSPWADQAAALAQILSLPLTHREKALILGENAARLLGIAAPPCPAPVPEHPCDSSSP